MAKQTDGDRTWAPQRLASGPNPAVTPEGLHAARLLRQRWEMRTSDNPRLANLADKAIAAAARRMPPRMWSLLVWCVCQEAPAGASPTASAWAEAHGLDRHTVAGMLGAALDALAVHYGVGAPMPDVLAPGGRLDRAGACLKLAVDGKF